MADIKVSEMPLANTLNLSDLLMIVQAGTNKKITASSIKTILEQPRKYTVRRLITSSVPTYERLDDAVNLVANATHDGTAVRNDFDNIYPWSDIISYNYDTKARRITAYYGDPQFAFDGSNGQVLTRIPQFWYKKWIEDNYLYISISDKPIEDYIESPQFSVGRYPVSGTNEGVFSRSGYVNLVSKNITQFRTYCNNVGEGFGQLDYHYMLLQTLYQVEYASYYSQNTLGSGCTGLRINSSDVALIAEENTNRIVINTNSANNFIIGQQISLGTSTYNYSIAAGRTITSKENYSEGDITGVAITFDGEPVNIVAGNVIWSSTQASGQCDDLGMKSGCLVNDGKHSVIYRGIENIFGNMWQFIDGINIKDNVAYVSYNSSDYKVDKFDGSYKALGYTNANTVGWVKELGFDPKNPLMQFPTVTGGGASATTYITDYYYQDQGNRVAHVGGRVDYEASAGLWYWSVANVSGLAHWAVRCSPSI